MIGWISVASLASFQRHICGNAMHIICIDEESWTDVVKEKYADFHIVRLIQASTA
jgi:hypothetical protein